MTEFRDLFTARQLETLTTLGDLVLEAREKVTNDYSLSRTAPRADYADSIATYLGLCASKMAMFHCSLSRWRSGENKSAPAFGRQAIAMVWDYAEVAPINGAGGDWMGVVDGAAKTLEGLPRQGSGIAEQAAAQEVSSPWLLSTDPPYYDNIGYSDLSDFFYIWLRRSLRTIYPELLSTLLVPKADELVANPYRHGGPAGAKRFFEEGFRHVFEHARASALDEYPITVYYAFKQSESDLVRRVVSY